MPHEIHVSERRSFRGCRRRWNWAYREGYVPVKSPKPLEFGVAYHKAMEVMYDPNLWSLKPEKIQERITRAYKVFEDTCEEQKQLYLAKTESYELDPDVEEDYEDRIVLGHGMLKYYGEYVQPKFDTWFKPVTTEVAFEVPIAHPDDPDHFLHCFNSPYCGQTHSNNEASTDSLVVYAGRIDLLVEDIRYGGYYIWDHKTAASLTREGADGFLQLDDQIGSYCWALYEGLNLDIRGFIYAESRKDYPQPPKLLKRKMGGRSFSTAATQATSIELFEPFVKTHDPIAYGEGAYDEYIKHLRSNDAILYHQRFPVVKTREELEEIGKNIALEAADMVDGGLRIYPSVGRYSCSGCAYYQPCIATFRQEDAAYQLETNFFQTDRKYWMEQQRNSEKRV